MPLLKIVKGICGWAPAMASIFSICKNRKVMNYFPPSLEHAPARAKIVNVVYEDKQNNLWVGTLNHGLWLLIAIEKFHLL
jgi:ligand-binding sensor domain-containing protein